MNESVESAPDPAPAPQPNTIWFGDVRLDRVRAQGKESDRFETPLFGPHPIGVWVSRRSAEHQWCASFRTGVCAYAWDPQDALHEACERAAESCRYQALRLERLADFGRWEL